jgi:hypothetical protein
VVKRNEDLISKEQQVMGAKPSAASVVRLKAE